MCKQQTCASRGSGACEAKGRGPADLGSGEDPLPGSYTASSHSPRETEVRLAAGVSVPRAPIASQEAQPQH